MIRIVTAIAFSTLMAGSAFAAGAACSTASAAKFKSNLAAVLKSEGLTMKKLKVENGCYEVYAIDKSGKKVNVAYNAETLEKAGNPEAGEN
jgi:hypothetical protein